MIPNAITHYQTGFKVFETHEDYSPLNTIRNILYGWLLIKEKDRRCRNGKKDFFRKCDWKNLYGTHSSVATNTVYTDNEKAWGFRYTHHDRDLGPGRYWHIDIGVREEEGVATFYCRVSYARSHYDLSSEHPVPPTNTPRFIRDIVAKRSGLKVFSGEKEFRLFDQPVPITAGHGKDLAEWIESKNRRYAIIVFNPASDDMRGEASQMARDLAGKSQVLILDEDPDLADELRMFLHADLWVPRGKFRIFYPLNPAFPRPDRHRWFDPLGPDYQTKRQALVSSLLRVYNLEEPKSVTNISEVGRMVSMMNLRKRLSENSASGADMDEFQSMWDSREQDFEERESTLKQETEHWMSEVEQKEDELLKVKAKLSSLEFGQTRSTDASIELLPELKRHVRDLAGIVGVYSRIYGDRLIFADEAFKSASEFANCSILDRAWDMLQHVATTLYDLKFGDGEPGDIASQFQHASGFEYAKTEGKQSKADASICASRQITVNGKKYEIWPHIKWGTKPPKTLRIHFAFCEDSKKIVIGYVGEHMRNATTRGMK